jgi:hypothetical protein
MNDSILSRIEIIDRVLQYNKIPDGLLIRTDSLEESKLLKSQIEAKLGVEERLKERIIEEQQIQLKLRDQLNLLDEQLPNLRTYEYEILEDRLDNSALREQELQSILEGKL